MISCRLLSSKSLQFFSNILFSHSFRRNFNPRHLYLYFILHLMSTVCYVTWIVDSRIWPLFSSVVSSTNLQSLSALSDRINVNNVVGILRKHIDVEIQTSSDSILCGIIRDVYQHRILPHKFLIGSSSDVSVIDFIKTYPSLRNPCI